MGDLLDTIKRSDVVESVDRRTQSTVQTEDLVFNESSEGEVVEEVGEVFPHVRIAVFAKALVVEAVDLGDLTGFVVATKDGNTLGVTNLQADQKGHSFDGIVSSIDIITCGNTRVLVRMIVVWASVQLTARKFGPTRCFSDRPTGKLHRLTHEEIVCIRVGATDAEELH